MIDARRRLVVELAAHLATQGGDPLGPFSVAMTEGRIAGYMRLKPPSSSCGDLLHCVAFAAGYRGPAMNRTEHLGWVAGVNLSRWFVPPLDHERTWKPKLADLQPGDFICYDYTVPTAHGAVFLGSGVTEAGEPVALTADAGQPGIRLRTCPVLQGATSLALRGRIVSCSVSLDALTFDAEPETVPGWLARHGLPVEPVCPQEYLA
ncbi:MAG: hypothetical protein M0R37_13965 [Bacteroidales bacterium]|nr:hypothetical protein [Bacteroidales bacterium]